MHRIPIFSGLRVAVTGGTSGLGLALVRQLSARGARVAFVARTARRVERTARETGAARHRRRRRRARTTSIRSRCRSPATSAGSTS